ncbi:MAG: preprotein translocase subunit YajC [Chloroflexota bacterium]
MLISKAYAQSVEIAGDIAATPEAPDAAAAFAWNMGLVLVLVVLFYILLIAPQQRRFKEHSKMLSELKKGDKVVTGGGLVGKIDKIIDEKEVVVDLGGGTKVTALLATLQGKDEPADAKDDKKKKDKDVK